MTTKHTKGPWRNENGDIIGQYTEFSDLRIASVNYGHPLQEANAAVIIRAVNCHAELLGALELVANSGKFTCFDDAAWETVNNAIKSAKGE